MVRVSSRVWLTKNTSSPLTRSFLEVIISAKRYVSLTILFVDFGLAIVAKKVRPKTASNAPAVNLTKFFPFLSISSYVFLVYLYVF